MTYFIMQHQCMCPFFAMLCICGLISSFSDAFELNWFYLQTDCFPADVSYSRNQYNWNLTSIPTTINYSEKVL